MVDFDMNSISEKRKQVITEFSGMTIDMDYQLCIPSIHAIYGNENIVMDFEGEIREKSVGFPKEKILLLADWINIHSSEIITNHNKCGCNDYPLNPIKPL